MTCVFLFLVIIFASGSFLVQVAVILINHTAVPKMSNRVDAWKHILFNSWKQLFIHIFAKQKGKEGEINDFEK